MKDFWNIIILKFYDTGEWVLETKREMSEIEFMSESLRLYGNEIVSKKS